MNELEIARVRKSQAVIAKIAVDGKKVGLSYGQLQAQRYEQELKLRAIEARSVQVEKKPQTEAIRRMGRPHKEKPDGFEECVEMIRAGKLTMVRAVAILHTSYPTLRKWIKELDCDS